MVKTKTQAQKNEEKEAKNREKKERMDEERKEKARKHKEEHENKQRPSNTVTIEDKRAQRKIQNQIGSDQTSNSTVTQPSKPSSKKEIEEINQLLSEKEETEETRSARLVLNHSTHCPGLIKLLTKLEPKIPGCVIVPGKLSSVPSNSQHFKLRHQREESDSNAYKFVARSGHTAQDVAIVIQQEQESFFTPEKIQALIKEILEENFESRSSNDSNDDYDDDTCNHSELNRVVAKVQVIQRKQNDQKNFQKEKSQQEAANNEKDIANRERKLANKKDVEKKDLNAYAKRDEDIVTGKSRTKNSMKK